MLKKLVLCVAICQNSFANDANSSLQGAVFAWVDRHDSTINALMPSTFIKKAENLAADFAQSQAFPKIIALAIISMLFSPAFYHSMFDPHHIYARSGHYTPENAKFSPYNFNAFNTSRKLLSNETAAHLVSLPYAAAPLDTREHLFENQLNADVKLQKGLAEYKEKGTNCGESRAKFDEIFLKCMQSAKSFLKATELPTCGIFIEDGAETTWRCVHGQTLPDAEAENRKCRDVDGYNSVVALYDSKTRIIIARPSQPTSTIEVTKSQEQSRTRNKIRSKTLKLSRTKSQEASKSQSIPGTLSMGSTRTITMLVELQQSSTQTKTSQYPLDITFRGPFTEEYCLSIYLTVGSWFLSSPNCENATNINGTEHVCLILPVHFSISNQPSFRKVILEAIETSIKNETSRNENLQASGVDSFESSFCSYRYKDFKGLNLGLFRYLVGF